MVAMVITVVGDRCGSCNSYDIDNDDGFHDYESNVYLGI